MSVQPRLNGHLFYLRKNLHYYEKTFNSISCSFILPIDISINIHGSDRSCEGLENENLLSGYFRN